VLHKLYSSPNVICYEIKEDEMGGKGHIVRMGEIRHAYKNFAGRTKEKRPL
jgi:hypothetical protein